MNIQTKEKNIPNAIIQKAKQVLQTVPVSQWASIKRPNLRASFVRVGSDYRMVHFKETDQVLLLSMGKYKKVIDRL